MSTHLSREDVSNIIAEIDLTRNAFFNTFDSACSTLNRRLDVIDSLLNKKEDELKYHIEIVRKRSIKKPAIANNVTLSNEKPMNNVIQNDTHNDKNRSLESKIEIQQDNKHLEQDNKKEIFNIPPEPDFLKEISVPQSFLS